MGSKAGYRVGLLEDHVASLWACAVVFFVVGDLATTSMGLASPHVREVGPVVRPVVEQFGFPAVVLLKVLTVVACAALWRIAPSPYGEGVPFGLAALGVAVTVWNVAVLAAPW